MERMLAKAAWLVLVVVLVLGVSANACAQVSWGEEYGKRVRAGQTISALGENLFGEQVNLFNGTTEFKVTDIQLPGNSGLPVAFSRRALVGNLEKNHLLGSWDIDVPHVWTLSQAWNTLWGPANRCSQFGHTDSLRTEHWNGNLLHVPGGGGGEMLVPSNDPKARRPTDGQTYKAVTKSGWQFACLPGIQSGQGGEGFLARSPDGLIYRFDWMVTLPYSLIAEPGSRPLSMELTPRVAVRLYPTQVSDRFGNWVRYEWSGKRLLRIHANDGREITFGYVTEPFYPTSNMDGYYPASAFSKDRILTATAGGRTWRYDYAPNSTVLTGVTLPDGSHWGYPSSGFARVFRYDETVESTYECYEPFGDQRCEVKKLDRTLRCSHMRLLIPESTEMVMTHPSGAQGRFVFRSAHHGRTNVPYDCEDGGGDYKNADANYNNYPVFSDVWSIASKSLSGPGLNPASWTYTYVGLAGGYAPASGAFEPQYKTVTVLQPDGASEVHVFGKDANVNEGQLLATETRNASGTVLRRVDTAFVSNADAAGAPFPEFAGASLLAYSDIWSTAANRPERSTVIAQDGVTFSSYVNTYDAFARPMSVRKWSSLGYARTDVTEYHDDLPKWVLGQVKRQYNAETGIVVSQTDYDANALPWKTYAFGKLQQTLGYYADGTLATVTDGRNYTTTLSNWYRGIPRTIQHADGTSESASVNDNGWITSAVDENGYATGYGYDAMGRLASIAYPTGDSTAWNTTTAVFEQVSVDEYGIPPGHWRRLEQTGNARKLTYYDAMWRPIVEEVVDLANPGATNSWVAKRYDTSGRPSFASYPRNLYQSGWVAWASVNNGTRTSYDALDRVTRVEQDSELGVLATTTEYLSGFQTRVTNPRGLQTTNGYQAYDQPSTDLLRWSVQPEGKVIEVFRHAQLGQPTQLRQRNSDGSLQQSRYFVYDGYRQLCKSIEPEVGSTVMDYDAAGNVAWTASGHALPDTGSCNTAEGYWWGRRVDRTYDPRNRLKTLTFPDGNGNQTWTYTPDGLPQQIVTANDGGSQVINSYTYNRRRLLTGEGLEQPGWYSWGIGYGYDGNGNLAGQSYPTGLYIDYAPNALGQATRAGTYAHNVSYHPNGAIAQFTYGNGIVHSMAQNARQLPARSTDGGGALDHEYQYDPAANVTYIGDMAQGSSYSRWMSYDGLDRLTAAGSASFGGDHWHRFTYDALDNLKSWKLAGVKDYANYYYEPATNRLTNIQNSSGATVVGLGYDVQGNLANKNGQTYTFDYGNRLRAANGKEYYRYDGHGRRVLNWRPSTPLALFQYSLSGQVIHIADYSKTKSFDHIYLAGSLVAIREYAHSTWSQEVKYQHTDALGSPVAVSNEAAEVVDRTQYEPYGAAINKPAYDGVGYTGHVQDGATGLTYMQQRYYDPGIGRFLSVDPVSSREKGDNFNRYWYANNNPYRFNDPDGRETNPVSGQPYIHDREILNSAANPHKGHYGMVRNGGTKLHSGNDIAGKKGAPLVAPVSGRVVQSGYDGKNGGGYVLRIERSTTTKDGQKVFVHISHLNSLPNVKVGQIVVEGKTKVGEVGNSGNAKNEPPHAHLSVMVGGQGRNYTVDPQAWYKQNPPPSQSEK